MFFFFENRVVCEITRKKIYGRTRQATDDDIIQCVPIARRITKATNTNTEYVTLTPFPQQQWLDKRASMPHYTYISCVAGGD
jgi:hypothetical protein